jgi:hypothetical protein
MTRSRTQAIAPRGLRTKGVTSGARLALWVVFTLVFLAVWTGLWLPQAGRTWLDALLLLLASVASLTELGRELPGQNVLLVVVSIMVAAGLAQGLELIAGVGAGFFPAQTTRDAPGIVWGAAPLLWIVVLLTSRGTARLVLVRWRTRPRYGYMLLGCTVALMLLMDLGLQAFATKSRVYWTWNQPHSSSWFGPPCSHMVGFGLTALFILVFAIPALIDKKPASAEPRLATANLKGQFTLWVMANGLFLTPSFLHGLWLLSGLNSPKS